MHPLLHWIQGKGKKIKEKLPQTMADDQDHAEKATEKHT